MRLMQTQMKSQAALISIKQQPAKQKIQQFTADLQIQQPKANLSIKTIPSKLTIDQSQAWDEMNLKTIFKLTKEFADAGRQGVMEGIRRTVKQGEELIKIENGGNPLADQAVVNAYEPLKQAGIKFVPSRFAVKINYQPSELQIDVRINCPVINAESKQLIHHYTPGDVQIRMQQYQDLQIEIDPFTKEV